MKIAEVLIFDPLTQFLWAIAIASLFICAIRYFNMGRKKEIYIEKRIMYAYSVLYIGFVLYGIFISLTNFLIQGDYEGHGYYGDYAHYDFLYRVFIKCAYVALIWGMATFFMRFESIVKKTKKLISISAIIAGFILIFTPAEGAIFLAHEVFFLPMYALFLLMLLILTKWSDLEFKGTSSFVFIGSIFIGGGLIFDSLLIKPLGVVPLIATPISFIMGASICLLPTIFDPQKLGNAYEIWRATTIATFVINCTFQVIAFLLNLPLFVQVGNLIFTIYIFVLLNKTLHDIKIEINLETSGELKKRTGDIMGVFTRPPKISEEEIRFHKELRICLVCKEKIKGFNFMCTDCSALYCKKCSKNLSTTENACWVCDTAFIDPKEE